MLCYRMWRHWILWSDDVRRGLDVQGRVSSLLQPVPVISCMYTKALFLYAGHASRQ